MISEMMAEASPWESDESEDWESDEAFDESDEGVEDISEARRRRRGRQSPGRQNRYRPVTGAKGVSVRGQGGGVKKLPFPAPLATAAETNKGLASQELGRRDLEEKVARLEKSLGVQQKNDSSVAGLVTLGVGGSLAAHGLFQAKELPGELTLKNWTDQTSTRAAALISVTQLATSGAKLLVNGRYRSSGVGIAADIFAAAQVATFAFGSLSKPDDDEFVEVLDESAARSKAKTGSFPVGTPFLTDTGLVFKVVKVAGGFNIRAVS